MPPVRLKCHRAKPVDDIDLLATNEISPLSVVLKRYLYVLTLVREVQPNVEVFSAIPSPSWSAPSTINHNSAVGVNSKASFGLLALRQWPLGRIEVLRPQCWVCGANCYHLFVQPE